MIEAVVFDMDGVLSDACTRQHYLEHPRRDWESFFRACGEDELVSEVVRLLELLDHPTESPYGNPIPGLAERGEDEELPDFMDGVVPLDASVGSEGVSVRIGRIS